MVYRRAGRSGVGISVIALGGHEYLPNGKSRGFNEDPGVAVRPGYTGKGYGGQRRRDLLTTAFDCGVNFFDVTIDPEKEALGRNLREVRPPYEVYIQTRPEGMGYSYDENNRKLATYGLLKAEVERCLVLLQRDRIDFLNFPFLQWALDADPGYLDSIQHNVARLKEEGLIRFATADTFSGEGTYLAQVRAGCFDALAMNFSFADEGARRAVLPEAATKGMAVITREVFLKGALFRMADEAGLADADLCARASLKWNLSVPEVTTAIVGAHTPEQFRNCLSVLEDLRLNDTEAGALDSLRSSPTYRTAHAQREGRFYGKP